MKSIIDNILKPLTTHALPTTTLRTMPAQPPAETTLPTAPGLPDFSLCPGGGPHDLESQLRMAEQIALLIAGLR